MGSSNWGADARREREGVLSTAAMALAAPPPIREMLVPLIVDEIMAMVVLRVALANGKVMVQR